jgi:hypothetical protein
LLLALLCSSSAAPPAWRVCSSSQRVASHNAAPTATSARDCCRIRRIEPRRAAPAARTGPWLADAVGKGGGIIILVVVAFALRKRR